VDALNAHAARLGYPFGAALALSACGIGAALAIAEELSALSFAAAAFAHSAGIHAGIVLASARRLRWACFSSVRS
jgi:hypothetical protein